MKDFFQASISEPSESGKKQGGTSDAGGKRDSVKGQHATREQQPAAREQQHATREPQPATREQQKSVKIL